MKHSIALLVLFTFLHTFSLAQSEEEKNVSATVDAFIKALLDADRRVLGKISASDLSYGHSSGKIENKSQFVTAVADGPVDFTKIETSEQTIQVSGNIAIVRHIFSAKTSANGKETDVRVGNMLVFRKAANWELLARQAYKL